jgi:hypothetical protein
MIATMRGFMPALERRLSIPIKSGSAAKVVPNPATKPRISDRWNRGTRRLEVSYGTNPWQLQRVIKAGRARASVNLLNRVIATMRFPRDLSLCLFGRAYSEAFSPIFLAGTGTSGSSRVPVPHTVPETAFHHRRVRRLQPRTYLATAISCRLRRAM